MRGHVDLTASQGKPADNGARSRRTHQRSRVDVGYVGAHIRRLNAQLVEVEKACLRSLSNQSHQAQNSADTAKAIGEATQLLQSMRIAALRTTVATVSHIQHMSAQGVVKGLIDGGATCCLGQPLRTNSVCRLAWCSWLQGSAVCM